MSLNNKYRKLENKLMALSLRERIIILFLIVALVLMAGQFLVFVPIQANYRVELNTQSEAVSRNETLENEYAQLQNYMADQTEILEVQKLEQELATINSQLDQLGSRMVTPQQMTQLLGEFLTKESKLKVISVEKLAMEAADKNNEGRLVRHRLRITLRGSYFESLRYLQRMEALPWRVYWDKLTYTVENYPEGELSVDKWLRSFFTQPHCCPAQRYWLKLYMTPLNPAGLHPLRRNHGPFKNRCSRPS